MTDPASSEPVERCPDCGRAKAQDNAAFWANPSYLCGALVTPADDRNCANMTITRLRSDLADSSTKLRAIAAVLYGRDPSEPFIYDSDALASDVAKLASVRALSEAERAVVEAAIRFRNRDASESSLSGYPTVEGVIETVDALLALRKDQTDGD